MKEDRFEPTYSFETLFIFELRRCLNRRVKAVANWVASSYHPVSFSGCRYCRPVSRKHFEFLMAHTPWFT
jgi:hypothetical protein